jgi:ribose-phosphate pyrophosphokinase
MITLVGNVRDKPVIIIDDMIDKAGSWIAAAETVVKRGGATKVYCMATHGLFGGDALQELENCAQIDKIIVTNSYPIPAGVAQNIKKLVVLDVSGLLAEAIRRNNHGESISALYRHFDPY